jgi:hypothetical protein
MPNSCLRFVPLSRPLAWAFGIPAMQTQQSDPMPDTSTPLAQAIKTTRIMHPAGFRPLSWMRGSGLPLGMLFSLSCTLLAAATLSLARPGPANSKRQSGAGVCGTYESAATVKAPKANPWAQITPAGNAALGELLHNPKSGLNFTLPGPNATQTDNYVAWIDTLRMC